ncbi:hypothetical protein E6O75_ATG00323 [Venturia nashicola]|uniref:Uncharacterized protein n=1 Tax=Venturia nashicola TaxID=86259 RepID=A0A4Z1PG30_9PEZI|nr:hypothetical protein E6O75_ATG00323 [Venturia nashicola]
MPTSTSLFFVNEQIYTESYLTKLTDLKGFLDKHVGIKVLRIGFIITDFDRDECRAVPSREDLDSWFMLRVQDTAVLVTSDGMAATWRVPRLQETEQLKWKKSKRDLHELLAELEKSMVRKSDG